MKALESLFGQSPFVHLQTHMQQVSRCVEALKTLFNSLPQPLNLLQAKAEAISDLKQLADLTRVKIKKSLSKALFLPVNRDTLLQALSFQDAIAATCERLAHELSLYPLNPKEPFAQEFKLYREACFETFDEAFALVLEYDTLISSSFGGSEAERIDRLVEEVSIDRHSCRQKEYHLLRALYSEADEMNHAQFYLWNTLIRKFSRIALQSEKLVYRMRYMLESR